MPVLGAVIGAGAAIGGGLLASGAAKSAANTQAQAARDAQAAQERMFEKQIALQEPFRQGGMTAQNRLMTLLGLNPNAGQPAVSSGGARQYQTPYGDISIPGMQNGYAGYGATTAAPATNAQGIVVDPSSPDFGKYARDFSMQDFTQDPGYAFRLAEGQKALERSASARLGVQSGAARIAAVRYGQEMGSQEYQNAFNRYQINRSNQITPLFELMNTGIGAANNLTNAAGQQGQNQASNIYNAGNAMASGQVGSANAWGGAFGNIANSIGNAYARQSSYGNPSLYGSRTSAIGGMATPSWNGSIDVGTVAPFGG
jgi:hypothetical protein